MLNSCKLLKSLPAQGNHPPGSAKGFRGQASFLSQDGNKQLTRNKQGAKGWHTVGQFEHAPGTCSVGGQDSQPQEAVWYGDSNPHAGQTFQAPITAPWCASLGKFNLSEPISFSFLFFFFLNPFLHL